jgi:uncharacterized FlaG/YvyC family protein
MGKIEEIEGIQSVDRGDYIKEDHEVGIEMAYISKADKEILNKKTYYFQENQIEKLTEKDVKDMVEKIKKIMEALDTNIDVKIKHYKDIPDLILGMQIVFEDKRTKKVIKEIPPEKLLKLYRDLLEKIGFFLIDKRV